MRDLKEAASVRKEETDSLLRQFDKDKFDWHLKDNQNEHKMKGFKDELARTHFIIDDKTRMVENLKEEKKSSELESFRKEQERQSVSRERLLQRKKTLDLQFERERNLELNIKLASSQKENGVISSQLASAKVQRCKKRQACMCYFSPKLC